MQFLMILLVMIGVIVLMVSAVAGISYGLGVFLNSGNGIIAQRRAKGTL